MTDFNSLTMYLYANEQKISYRFSVWRTRVNQKRRPRGSNVESGASAGWHAGTASTTMAWPSIGRAAAAATATNSNQAANTYSKTFAGAHCSLSSRSLRDTRKHAAFSAIAAGCGRSCGQPARKSGDNARRSQAAPLLASEKDARSPN